MLQEYVSRSSREKIRFSLRSPIITFGVGLSLFACTTLPTQAQGLRAGAGNDAEIASLDTGDQLVLSARNGAIEFAGRNVELSNFTGIIGYATEIAYVVVLEGTADYAGKRAKRGKMLMFPPYGAPALVERFDAARLRDVWPEDLRNQSAAAFASLDQLAGAQATGVLFGRLGRTNFNVSAPDSTGAELGRRSVMGGPVVRAIRFGTGSDAAAIELNIVNSVVAALKGRDANALAELIDPLPFGNMDLRSGASGARMLTAEALIAERDWSETLSGEPQKTSENDWAISGPKGRTLIALRPTSDFAYLANISVGN